MIKGNIRRSEGNVKSEQYLTRNGSISLSLILGSDDKSISYGIYFSRQCL